MKVWCVEHRDGWCATSRQAKPPKADENNVRTKCGWFVVLCWGVKMRRPTCPRCVALTKGPAK